MDDRQLLDRQAALQAAADAAAADLSIDAVLGTLGEPVRVGSSAFGLMVWPDLDVTVVCARLAVPLVAALGQRLAVHPRVRQVVFRNDSRDWNTDPGYPDGLYLGLRYRGQTGEDWKVDIWFVDEPDRQPDLAHLRSLPPRLTDETRLAILRVKAAMWDQPGYGSCDVYAAVLDHGVRTVEEFRAWAASGEMARGER